MSWEYIRLGELYEVHNGLSKGGKFFGDGFPFLSFSTVFNNWFLPAFLPDLVQSTEKEQLYRGVIEGLQLLIPTQETLNKTENMLSAIHDKITALNSQMGLLVEARDRLLPKLMSGEIEV